MKKITNKARIKRTRLDVLCEFINTLNYKIEDINKRHDEIQENLRNNPDDVYSWDKEWCENGTYEDELKAYENLLKDIEYLI